MATKPTPGASAGTWGTEMNTFLDVSLASDGKIIDGAVLEAATETADGDRTVADLGYVKTGDTVQHDAEGGYSNCDVNGTKAKVYTKYFTGTLDADASTSVAHGVTTGLTKILSVTVAAFTDNINVNVVGDFTIGAFATTSMSYTYDGTNVIIASVGTNIQGNAYYIRVDYIL